MPKSGFDDAVWESAKAEAKRILIARARLRGTIHYSELVSKIHPISFEAHDPRLALFLKEISTEENVAGHGMLTAVVVHKHGDMQPGPGFFELARALRRDTSDILRCWIAELDRVHAYWNTRAGDV